MTTLNASLHALGFESSEIDLYLYLLRAGGAPVGSLAKRLGRPRTTLYTMLARLTEAGLLRETVTKGLKSYSAESPDVVNYLFTQRIGDLEKSRSKFAEALPSLRSQFRTTPSSPRFQVFEGKLGLNQVLSDMLFYGDLQTAAVWPIRKMMEVLTPEFFRFHNRERVRRNIYTRAVWPESEVVTIRDYPFLGWGPEFKREIRIAPKDQRFTLGYWIYADKVAFLSSDSDGYGFIIQSAQLVETLLVQFDLLWSVAKPLAFDIADVQKFIKEELS